jgi:uncharacterized membrane protein
MMIALTLHLAAAGLAVPLGGAMLLRRKGTVLHRLGGRVWVVLMAVLAISSFWLASPTLPHVGGFGPLHALSFFVLLCLLFGVRAVRRGDVRRHRRWMIGPYAGLIVAGLAALVPGRLLSIWLFG